MANDHQRLLYAPVRTHTETSRLLRPSHRILGTQRHEAHAPVLPGSAGTAECRTCRSTVHATAGECARARAAGGREAGDPMALHLVEDRVEPVHHIEVRLAARVPAARTAALSR
jgi:hypothetical protein